MPRKVTDSYGGPASFALDAGAGEVTEVTCHHTVSADYPTGLDGPTGLVS
jgi:hypothetical protein